MIKLYKIELKDIDVDDDASMVILSESAEKALELAKQKWIFALGHDYQKATGPIWKRKIDFNIIEINQFEEQIVDVSHAGL